MTTVLPLLVLATTVPTAFTQIQRGPAAATMDRNLFMNHPRVAGQGHRRRVVKSVALTFMGLGVNWNRKAAFSQTFEQLSQEVTKAFRSGDYEKVESICSELLSMKPDDTYVWSLLGTSELILGSQNLTMSGSMTDNQRDLLLQAIQHFDKSTSLASSIDPLTINNKANALGLLDRWEEAITNYELAFQLSLDSRMKDFEVIPMMNKALALFEIRRDAQAEEELNLILRRHADYEDAFAGLSAIRWGKGDKFGAADSFDQLCQLDYGICDAYSDIRIVLGRWPRRAITEYRAFLQAYLNTKKQTELVT